MLGMMSNRYPFLHPPSWPLQKRSRMAFPFCLPFAASLVCFISPWNRPGRRANGSLQRAAFVRAAGGMLCVRLHDLHTIGRMR